MQVKYRFEKVKPDMYHHFGFHEIAIVDSGEVVAMLYKNIVPLALNRSDMIHYLYREWKKELDRYNISREQFEQDYKDILVRFNEWIKECDKYVCKNGYDKEKAYFWTTEAGEKSPHYVAGQEDYEMCRQMRM